MPMHPRPARQGSPAPHPGTFAPPRPRDRPLAMVDADTVEETETVLDALDGLANALKRAQAAAADLHGLECRAVEGTAMPDQLLMLLEDGLALVLEETKSLQDAWAEYEFERTDDPAGETRDAEAAWLAASAAAWEPHGRD